MSRITERIPCRPRQHGQLFDDDHAGDCLLELPNPAAIEERVGLLLALVLDLEIRGQYDLYKLFLAATK